MRSRVLVGSLLALAGCDESQLAATLGRTRTLTLANQQLQAVHLPNLASACEDLQRQIQAFTNLEQHSLAQVSRLQQDLVTVWHGDPTLLQSKMQRAKLAKGLAAYVEAAQREYGASTKEQQFLHALEEDADALGAILHGWEESAGFSAEADRETSGRTTKRNACKTTPVETSCEEIRSEENPPVRRFSCANKSLATLVVRGMGGPAIIPFRKLEPEVKSVVRSFDDGGSLGEAWLVRLEYDQPVSRSEGDRVVEAQARAWFGFLRFSPEPQLALLAAIPELGPPPLFVDLDGDGWDEVFLANPPRALHYSLRDREMQRWTVEQLCATPAADKTPALQPLCRASHPLAPSPDGTPATARGR
jgi:hypothetical protein